MSSSPGLAQVVEWDDGGVNKNWSNVFNWNPTGLPGSTHDVQIGNLAAAQGDATLIDQDFSVRTLSLSGGASADTNGSFLAVGAGGLDIGLASKFIVSPQSAGGVAFQTTGIDIANLGKFQLNGGRTNIGGAVLVNLGGEFTGFGTFVFQNGLSSPTTVFTNNGSLTTGRGEGALATDHFTLTIDAVDVDARIDLDGVNNDRVVSIVENTTLNLEAEAEQFWGTMSMSAGARLDMANNWIMRGSSVLNVNAGSPSSGVPATATLTGGHLNAIGAAQFNVNSGTLILDADFDTAAAPDIHVAPGAGLQFNGTTVINGDLNTSGIFKLTVNGDLTINDADFDWDGSGSPSSFTTINPGGRLTINASTIDSDNEFDSVININSGTLDANVASTLLPIAGTVNMHTADGNATMLGSDILLRGQLVADGGGTAVLSSSFLFAAGSSTTVAANTRVFLGATGGAIFQGGSAHTGSGQMAFAGNVTVDGATTVDMPLGEFALDASGGNQSLSLNDDLTIDVRSLVSDVGGNNGGTYTLNINNSTSTLQVNLTNPADEWTLGVVAS